MQDNTNNEKLESCKVVLVKNVIKSSDLQKTLGEFFSFCGTIQSISVSDDKNDPNLVTALITFESAASAKTAVLLNNTQINDRFITVEPWLGEANSNNVENGNNPQEPLGPVDSIIGIGVEIGHTAADAVRSIDENLHVSETISNVVQQIDSNMTNLNQEYKITQTISGVGETIKDKALEIDNTLQISNNANYVGESIKGTLTQIEQDHHISERVTATTEAIVSGVSQGVQSGVATISGATQSGVAAVSEFLQTNEAAKTGMEFVNDIGDSLSSTMNSLWSSITTPQNPGGERI